MKSIRLLAQIIVAIFTITTSFYAFATPCGELIYNKHGMLRKYEYLPNNISENTKKHATSSSTSHLTTETWTAGSDPGVTTGQSESNMEFTSSRGDCSLMSLLKTASRDVLKQYIAQNLTEIKDDIATGGGGHVQVLAATYNCDSIGQKDFVRTMRSNFGRFVDYTAAQSGEFADSLTSIVGQKLAHHCHSTLL